MKTKKELQELYHNLVTIGWGLYDDERMYMTINNAPVYETVTQAASIIEEIQDEEAYVMRLEDVLGQDNQVVWLEWIGCNVRSLQPTAVQSHGDFSVVFWNGEVHPKGLYGRQWRCWNRIPTDNQRETEGWGSKTVPTVEAK